MNDPRFLDSARRTEALVKQQAEDIRILKADTKYLKELLREVKKIVTRKYDKKEQTK